jgi:hypothetical protein
VSGGEREASSAGRVLRPPLPPTCGHDPSGATVQQRSPLGVAPSGTSQIFV